MLWIGVSFIGAGLVCLALYRLIGGEVGADGVLREPFALIPMGYAFLFVGGCLFLLRAIHAGISCLMGRGRR